MTRNVRRARIVLLYMVILQSYYLLYKHTSWQKTEMFLLRRKFHVIFIYINHNLWLIKYVSKSHLHNPRKTEWWNWLGDHVLQIFYAHGRLHLIKPCILLLYVLKNDRIRRSNCYMPVFVTLSDIIYFRICIRRFP